MNFDEWNVDFLADYIVNTHHNYVRKYLPEITGYAAKVAQVHGDKHPELLKINELISAINKELSAHLVEEETSLFPLIKEIVKAKNANSTWEQKGTFSTLVHQTEAEHTQVGKYVEEIRTLSHQYTIPEMHRLVFA